MFTLKIENENHEIITLTGRESRYQVLNIEGLNPPNANVRRSSVAGMDGTKYMSAKLEERNIVITIRINGNVEENRLQLYRWFKTRHWCKVYYSNGSRNVYIEGYIETNECPIFTENEQMQISIVCPDPYWLSAQEIVTDISELLGNFEFPFAFGANGMDSSIGMIDRFHYREFVLVDESDTVTNNAIEFSQLVENRIVSIVNEGEDETGLLIRIIATDTVVNPAIYNDNTKEFFKVKITMNENDVLNINTTKGQKSVMLTRGIETTNLINKLVRDSTWLTINKGENKFTYKADEGSTNMNIVFTHRTKYQGV